MLIVIVDGLPGAKSLGQISPRCPGAEYSVKVYNKSGSILRIETTISNSRDFRVFRHPDDDKNCPASWQKTLKGVSDLHRRCKVSDQCNERYADTLASAQVEEKLKEVVAPACNGMKKTEYRRQEV